MIPFILNFPYTLTGLVVTLISFPTSVKFHTDPLAIIFNVKKIWSAVGYMRGARAAAIGHIVLLSPSTEAKDLEHELVHVRQYQRLPLIFPILYHIEFIRNGYRNNKYEDEAYRLAENTYKEQ